MQTRRAHLASLVGAGVSAALPRSLRAAVGDDIPPEGIGRGIRHLSYSDQGGRPDGVQVMLHRGHLYVGHMFNDGVTVLDARDPRALKPLHFFTTAPNTRTHHLQVAEGLMLLANGANIVRMQAYDSTRDYFENTLADSLTNRQPFRAGLSIFDIDTNPAEPREIAFLPMPGIGVNRLWWAGGRYAYVSAHFDGFTDHILCIVDLAERHAARDRVALVAARDAPRRRRDADGAARQALRAAPHDRRRRPRLRGVARRRAHDSRRQRRRESEAAVARQLVAAVSRRHAYGAAAAAAPARRRRRRVERRLLREGAVLHLDRRRARRGESRADRDAADADGARFLRDGQLRPAQLAREPARHLRQRGDDLRDVSQRRRARVRHSRSVPAEGDRVVGAADAGAHARSAAARRAQRADLRLLRDDRRDHLRHRLERRVCTCSSTRAERVAARTANERCSSSAAHLRRRRRPRHKSCRRSRSSISTAYAPSKKTLYERCCRSARAIRCKRTSRRSPPPWRPDSA